MNDETWLPISTAPTDGTYIRAKALQPMLNGAWLEFKVAYVPMRIRPPNEIEYGGWRTEDGKGYAVGSWKSINKNS